MKPYLRLISGYFGQAAAPWIALILGGAFSYNSETEFLNVAYMKPTLMVGFLLGPVGFL